MTTTSNTPALITSIPGTTRGVTFAVRVIEPGQRYGRNDCLTNDGDGALVEFYDERHKGGGFDTIGQFVTRYNEEILDGRGQWSSGDLARTGLNLDGGIPDWSVSADGMGRVLRALRDRHLRPGNAVPAANPGMLPKSWPCRHCDEIGENGHTCRNCGEMIDSRPRQLYVFIRDGRIHFSGGVAGEHSIAISVSDVDRCASHAEGYAEAQGWSARGVNGFASAACTIRRDEGRELVSIHVRAGGDGYHVTK